MGSTGRRPSSTRGTHGTGGGERGAQATGGGRGSVDLCASALRLRTAAWPYARPRWVLARERSSWMDLMHRPRGTRSMSTSEMSRCAHAGQTGGGQWV